MRISAIILEPRTPHWPMRRAGFALAPRYLMAFHEHGEHFMLRPRAFLPSSVTSRGEPEISLRSQLREGGWTRKQIDAFVILRKCNCRFPIVWRWRARDRRWRSCAVA